MDSGWSGLDAGYIATEYEYIEDVETCPSIVGEEARVFWFVVFCFSSTPAQYQEETVGITNLTHTCIHCMHYLGRDKSSGLSSGHAYVSDVIHMGRVATLLFPINVDRPRLGREEGNKREKKIRKRRQTCHSFTKRNYKPSRDVGEVPVTVIAVRVSSLNENCNPRPLASTLKGSGQMCFGVFFSCSSGLNSRQPWQHAGDLCDGHQLDWCSVLSFTDGQVLFALVCFVEEY
ncbi:hypothetical protein VTK73DRAFT_8909 [Phialemonium thermophilum]|uniref:Uncharacterized protein n=1 Tax=Phialemonium thermophilum TaxID=223376 RepID=A0ABR3W5G8_9PEZI